MDRVTLTYTGIFLLLISFFVCGAAHAGETAGPDGDNNIKALLSHDHVKGEILVKFRDNVISDTFIREDLITRAHQRAAAVIKRRFRGDRRLHLVKIRGEADMKKALKAYLSDPNISYAEPNYLVYATQTPNDPDFSSLWGLHNTGQTGGTADADIDAPEAWDINTGADSVVVAVVDSGVAADSNISTGHPELVNNIWTNPGETSCDNNKDDDGNGYTDDCYGWDFVDNDNDPMDYAGHGSHVAGTIAAAGDNSQGVTGVMWNASIMALRFLDGSGTGSTADAISAIEYADANGADIINNSWGGGGFSQSLKDTIDASDALFVCAAGNSGVDTDTYPHYPSAYTSDNIISVAATDHNDSLAWFSNYGVESVDLAAPGVSIYSTLPARNELLNDPMDNLDNWTADAPWGLSTTYYSYPTSAADSPDGDYANNTSASLTIASPFNLSGLRGTVMDYALRIETETNYDFLCIDTSRRGVVWSNHICWHGSSGGSFYYMSEDFTEFDDLRKFAFRFRLSSDGSIRYDGAYIDDVQLTTYSDTYDGSEYAHYNGTSMAAPHVAGTAGLLKSLAPSLTSLEIKDIILNNAEQKDSLTGNVLTGGRLNAYTSLYSVSCPNQPVRINSTGAGYSSLQAAYDAAGSGDVIMSHDALFTEDVIADLNKSVTFEGGYDCGYTEAAGITSMNGNMTISYGSVVVSGLSLE